jgi:Leucine-rich repeat (LRR) protein
MKKTTLKETEATYDDKLAMIMAVGDATMEEASRTLAECGGDIDRALALLYNQAPPSTVIASSPTHNDGIIEKSHRERVLTSAPRTSMTPYHPAELIASSDITKQAKDKYAPYKSSRAARLMEEVDDESIAKPRESLMYASSHVAHTNATHAAKAREENVYKETPPLTYLGQFSRPLATSRTTMSANQHAGNQAQTKTIIPQDPFPHLPGAFAIDGSNNMRDDDNFTYRAQQTNSAVVDNTANAPANPTEPVAAQLVDNSDDVENLQEQLRQQDEALRQREQELEQIRRNQENVVVGQVLGVANNEDDNEEKAREGSSNNEEPLSSNNKLLCGSKQKMVVALVAVLAVVAIIVGIVAATSSNSRKDDVSNSVTPTAPPTTSLDDWMKSCDESSSSLAKKLPCVSLDTTQLDLYENSLTGSIPTQIGFLTQLTRLSLWDNSLTGSIPSEITLLTNLYTLSLWGNILTRSIPSEIGFLTQLTYLDLAMNSLRGMIPSEIGFLTQLTWLALESNSLMGTIPTQIGFLTQLNSLSLWYNSLTGSIPSEIALLTNLDSLFLSSNSLTGRIPSEIALLTNLAYLDLSENSLTGEFTCPVFIDTCSISCDPFIDDNVTEEECRSL